MKLLLYIFTIYMIALSLVPCGDGGGGVINFIDYFAGIERTEHSDHEQHSNDCGDDLCSPFCVCSCCSTVFDAPAKLPLRIYPPTPTPEGTPTYFTHLISSSFNHSIWQPPKNS